MTFLNSTIALAMFVAPTAFASIHTADGVLAKLARSSSPKAQAALQAFNETQIEGTQNYKQFVHQINAFRKFARQDSDWKALVKETRKACKSNASSESCSESKAKLENHFRIFFDGPWLRVGGNELFRDQFYGIAGYKLWGESAVGDRFMVGLGFELARSLFNISTCLIPTFNSVQEPINVGVVASAVLGAGVTSGVYFGTNGVCFDFGLMYGVGAYVAVADFYLSDRRLGDGGQMQMQRQIQLQGDEEFLFPRQIGAKKRTD